MKRLRISGKIIGLLSGLLVTGNFIGALLATLLGHFLFDFKENNGSNYADNEVLDDQLSSFKANILRSILSVSVYFVLKTKNRILVSDINTIKEYFIEHFRFDMNDIVLIEKNIINLMNQAELIDIRSIASVVNQNCLYNEKINIIELLFILGSPNFQFDETKIISAIANLLNIKRFDFNLIKGRFCDTSKYFTILELDTNASIKDIKKAYRRLVAIHHPDKAKENYDKEKFQTILEAYNYLINNSSIGS